MPRQSPGIFGGRFCMRCGMRQRSPNHVCQPSSLAKWRRVQAWVKKSAAAHQPVKAKK